MPEEITLRLDPRSGIPAVRQITEGMRILLVEGKLLPGACLPSVRRLAMELGVHFNTVAEAYRQLAAEGWLDLRHGRGAIVVWRPEQKSEPEKWLGPFRGALRSLIAQVRAGGAPAEQVAQELISMAKAVNES